jgi:spore germination protein YaaH
MHFRPQRVLTPLEWSSGFARLYTSGNARVERLPVSFSRIGLCRLLLSALAILAGLENVKLPGVEAATLGKRWAFYVTYDVSSKASLIANLAQLDVVVPDYYSLKAPGALAGSGDAAVDQTLQRAGVSELPLVQSSYSGAALSPFLNDSARRQALIESIAAAAGSSTYRGMTVDFEGIDPKDRSAFTEFVRDLASALHHDGKCLAVAVPAADGSTATSQWAGAYDYAAIGLASDAVVVMAYAYRTALNPQPGPISPLPWVAQVASYAASQIPASRLVLGLGAWGYDWNVTHPGRAAALRYANVIEHAQGAASPAQYDAANASLTLSYQLNGDHHVIWFENATSLTRKVAAGQTAGISAFALWRLGEEDPSFWLHLSGDPAADFPIPNGWFFTETGGGDGLGYRVVDGQAHFWTEFQRLGGVATLGYPSSRAYVGLDGFIYQAFQRALLQWRPEIGAAYLANTFDILSAGHRDQALVAQGVPLPIADDGSRDDWNRARVTRLGWLTNLSIAATFHHNPNARRIANWDEASAIQLFGLPTSLPTRSGPFIVQRFQRVSLQEWVDEVPGMPPPGTVVGLLGGDFLKSAGVIPPSAAAPELPY